MRPKMLPSLAILAALVFACGSKPVAPGSWPIKPPDTTECQAMCSHFKDLKCEEGEDIYNSDLPGPPDVPNQTCSSWCEELQGKGMFLNPRCLKRVPSCPLIEEYRKQTCTG